MKAEQWFGILRYFLIKYPVKLLIVSRGYKIFSNKADIKL